MAISKRQFDSAKVAMAEARQAGHAIAARYDRRHGRIVVDLHNGMQIATPSSLIEGLAGAAPTDLATIEISPGGLGLHWPRLDVDVHLPSLMQGLFGSKTWMAALLGSQGGRATSEPKRAAARQNGLKGGRPRKAVAT